MKRFQWVTLIVISAVALQAWAKPFKTRDSHKPHDSYEVIDSNYYPTQPVQQEPVQQESVQQELVQRGDDKVETVQQTSAPMLLERLNTLRQEMYQLQGQLDVQAQQLQHMKQQQQEFYQAMENRLTQLVQKDTPTTKTSAAAASSTERNRAVKSAAKSRSTNPAAEQAAYVAAYELVRKKNYPQAIKSMRTFIERYPDSQYAANAHYWLGELYLAEQQLKESTVEFEIVLNKFPNSTKVAPAMLKLGYAYLGLGEDHKAKQQLQKVQQQFPGSHAARLAAARLKEMS
ncbi:MAG: tol-pal system protein YbgF [Legionellales bacterium]|nr:tol-pal system protein YbgF [Legionellales bacterium]